MEKALVIVMLVLLAAPVLVGVRRLRRTLAQGAEAPGKAQDTDDESGPA